MIFHYKTNICSTLWTLKQKLLLSYASCMLPHHSLFLLCLLTVPSIMCLFLTSFVISLYSLEMFFFYDTIKWCQQHGHVLASCIQFPGLLMTYSETNFMSQAGQFPPLFVTYSNTKFVSHSSQFPTLLMSFWYKIRIKRLIIHVLDCNEP